MAESTPCIFYLFHKSTRFCLLRVYTNKSRLFTDSNDVITLLVQDHFKLFSLSSGKNTSDGTIVDPKKLTLGV